MDSRKASSNLTFLNPHFFFNQYILIIYNMHRK
jgi:hypothetical protein